ncbi:MAG TPA: hypothetical protein ENN29_03665, partial [Candidatus Hydrogenedentes bacterium]|nr:hypothetical protein [Candidatus Hydrogenedentota bacterium]
MPLSEAPDSEASPPRHPHRFSGGVSPSPSSSSPASSPSPSLDSPSPSPSGGCTGCKGAVTD